MTTEAGERLLDRMFDPARFLHRDHPLNRAATAEIIAAIEAEAVAAERARIAEAVRGLPNQYGPDQYAWVARAHVLAIIEPKP